MKPLNWPMRGLATTGAVVLSMALAACGEHPPVETVQHGYRGLGLEQVYNPRHLAEQAPLNAMPPDSPMVPTVGPPARTVFKNVQVVGDISVAEFTRLMVSMTAWVSPQQGCAYCHKPGEDFSVDALYTKVVARRMLQMTRHVNTDWKTHVADTGVTCYTCHRGQPVPAQVWHAPADQPQATRMLGNDAEQNRPAQAAGMSSLPYDPFTPFLQQRNNIRVVGPTALASGNRQSIKQTEYTYSLMTHMSESLGVNCTYCHNSRSFASWEASTPQRATAWYGIRMARDLNLNYIVPLTSTFPPERLGPKGDAPQVNCATCHQGAFKPMYGASLLKTHPELAGARAPEAAAPPADAASATTSDAGPAAADPARPAVAVAVR